MTDKMTAADWAEWYADRAVWYGAQDMDDECDTEARQAGEWAGLAYDAADDVAGTDWAREAHDVADRARVASDRALDARIECWRRRMVREGWCDHRADDCAAAILGERRLRA